MTLDFHGLDELQVKCDGAFPCTRWINFTDLDPRSPAYGGSFCVLEEVDVRDQPISIPLYKIRAARDRKRAEFAAAQKCISKP